MENFSSLILSTAAGLHKCLSNVEMLRLDDAVSSRVIARDPNVVDAVSLAENIESGDIRGSVVSNELGESVPTAQDILEDEVGDDLGGVGCHSMTLWVGGESAASMENVMIRPDIRKV